MIIQLVIYWVWVILKKRYRLIAVDLSRKKALDADSRAIQRMVFTGKITATQNNKK